MSVLIYFSYLLVSKNNESKQSPVFTPDEIITHTLVGNNGEVHIFWHNYPEPVHLYLGGYGISVPHNEKVNISEQRGGILIQGGEYYSLLQPIKTQGGYVGSETLNPDEGWQHTHLYGGKGAFTFWKSNSGVPPNKPVIFYVNGTRGRLPKFEDIKIQSFPGMLKIQFEGKWFDIKLPF